MLCEQSTHVWLGRFSQRLMQLYPGIKWRTAVARGVYAFPHAHELTSEEAARFDALLLRQIKLPKPEAVH